MNSFSCSPLTVYFEIKLPEIDELLHDDDTLTEKWRYVTTMCVSSNTTNEQSSYDKVSKKAKIRNRRNQVPHLHQDITWESVLPG